MGMFYRAVEGCGMQGILYPVQDNDGIIYVRAELHSDQGEEFRGLLYLDEAFGAIPIDEDDGKYPRMLTWAFDPGLEDEAEKEEACPVGEAVFLVSEWGEDKICLQYPSAAYEEIPQDEDTRIFTFLRENE